MSSKNEDIVRKVAEHLVRLFKIKSKTIPSMRGGANMVDFISKSKKINLNKDHRKVLIKELNKYIRDIKKTQMGGGVIDSLFTGKKAKSWWKSFARGFTSVIKPAAKIAGPILGALGMPIAGIASEAVGNVL
jgi:hypothetical protein